MSQTSIYQSGEYLRNNPSWHAEDAGWKFGHVMQLMQRNGLEPKSVVDVGTGAGEVLKLLAEKFPDARLTGFDISPDARLDPQLGSLSFHRNHSAIGYEWYSLAR